MTEPTAPAPEHGSEAAARILTALDRVVDRGLTDASDRQRSLLRYLVTEEVEGRGDRLKAYSIGTQVFDRGAGFDPQQDAIVRVEVGRLRKSLELYYATAGRLDPVRITVEKGQYRPSFELREPFAKPKVSRFAGLPLRAAVVVLCVAAFGAGIALWATRTAREPDLRSSPRIAIAPFSLAADRPGQDYIAAGLRAELVSVLSEFEWLAVFPVTRAVDLVADGRPSNWKVDFLVRASVQVSGETVTVSPMLLDGQTGAVRWSRRYEAPFSAAAVNAMQRDIATRIAADVGQPFGVVADLERTRATMDSFQGDAAFRCSLRTLQFWATYRRDDYSTAIACASRLGAASTADPNMQAVLAMLRVDGARFGFDTRPREIILAEASELAAQAYRRSDRAALPRAARYSAALCDGETETFRRIGLAAVRDYPNNPAVLLDVGSKLALGAEDWGQGLELVARGRALTSYVPNWYDIAETVDAIRLHKAVDAGALHVAALDTDHPVMLLTDLAVQAHQQRMDAAREAASRLAQLGYVSPPDRMALLDGQCATAAVKDLMRPLIAAADQIR